MRNFFTNLIIALSVMTQSAYAMNFADRDINDFKSKTYLKYDTLNHQKAKGLRIIIPYPNSWSKVEGNHPNIVQKLQTTLNNRYLISTMIRIKELPVAADQNLSNEQIKDEEFRKSFCDAPGMEYIESGETSIDGENAFYVFYSQHAKTLSMHINLLNLSYNTAYDGKLISITHSVGGFDGNEDITDLFMSYIPVFELITTGIVIHNKWTN